MEEDNLGNKEEIIEEKTYRNWMILLYSDTTSYNFNEVIFNITSLKNFAYIKHLPEDDEKKEHYHVYIELNSATTQERLSQLPDRFRILLKDS